MICFAIKAESNEVMAFSGPPGIGVFVAVGVAVAAISTEPMSQITFCGRVTPFSEVLLTGGAAQVALLPVSLAALPTFKGK